MTILDDILDASTNPEVSTSDLLRKVQIAATRLGAQEIVTWARAEIMGYENDDVLPAYRVMNTNVMGLFTGPMQSRMTHQLTAVPNGMGDLWRVELREPIVEIQALSEGDDDPQRQWAAYDVQRYERSGVYTIEFMGLFTVWNTISRQSLRGLVDMIRSRAMEFALDLQAQYPEAGSVGGPTVATEPGLGSTVYNIWNTINGHGANIAAGPGAHQTSSVTVGDLASLRREVEALGLDEAERDEFVAAVEADQDVDGRRVQRFLARVRGGAVRLAEGLTTDVAAETLVALGRGFLGIGG